MTTPKDFPSLLDEQAREAKFENFTKLMKFFHYSMNRVKQETVMKIISLAAERYKEQGEKEAMRYVLQLTNAVVKKNRNIAPIQSAEEGEQLLNELYQQFKTPTP